MTVRSTTWRDLVVKANPNHTRESRFVREYEFSAPGGGANLDERTYKDGKRIFEGDYQERGPYVDEVAGADDLIWNGVPISWNGEPLTWDD